MKVNIATTLHNYTTGQFALSAVALYFLYGHFISPDYSRSKRQKNKMADPQTSLQTLSEQYQKLQQGMSRPILGHSCEFQHKVSVLTCVLDLQSHVSARQRLESQQQENIGVQKEFSALDEDANIYKLVGPVLLKQEKTEAVLAVDGRLEFIGNEM